MKITYQGQNGFLLEANKSKVICNPPADFDTDVEFATNSVPNQDASGFEAKKVLSLPGEFEISKILVKGIYSDNRENVVFKIVSDDIAIAHMGAMTEIPTSKWLEDLGENVSLIMITVSEKLNARDAKELIDKIDPRYALVTGDATQFPKLTELGGQTSEEPTVTLSKSSLSEDRTDILLFS